MAHAVWLFGPEVPAYTLVLVMGAAAAVAALLPPLYLKLVIDRVLLAHRLADLLPLLILGLLTLLARVVLREARDRVDLHIWCRMRARLLDRLGSVVAERRLSDGDIAVLATQDIRRVLQVVTETPQDALEAGVRLTFIGVLAWRADPYLLVAAAGLLAVQSLVQNRMVVRRAELVRVRERLDARYLEFLGRAGGDRDFHMTGPALAARARRSRVLLGHYERLVDLDWRVKFGNVMAGNGSTALAEQAVTGALALVAVGGRLDPGTFVALLAYFSQLNIPVGLARGAYIGLVANAPHFLRLSDSLGQLPATGGHGPRQPAPSVASARGPVSVVLEGVQLVGSGGVPLLAVRERRIGPGGLWQVVGPNGAGKSWLGRCVAGSETPTRGRVTVEAGGQALDRLESVQRVGPESHLCAGTLRAAVSELAPADRMLRRALALRSERWRSRLPHGLFSSLGTDYQPSRGEELFLCLVRALAIAPAVVVLDDVLRTLDASLRADALALSTQRAGLTVILTPEPFELPAERTLRMEGGTLSP